MYIDYSGRYRDEGSHIRGEYTAKIYGVGKLEDIVKWKGYI